MERLAALCAALRPNIRRFALQFDQSSERRITLDQMARCLASAGLDPTRDEIALIGRTFSEGNPPTVDYEEVIATLEDVHDLSPVATMTVFEPKILINSEDEAACQEIVGSLRRKIVSEGAFPYYHFEDFDVHNTGMITQAQFERALSQLYISVYRLPVSPRTLSLLSEKYTVVPAKDVSLVDSIPPDINIKQRMIAAHRFIRDIGGFKPAPDPKITPLGSEDIVRKQIENTHMLDGTGNTRIRRYLTIKEIVELMTSMNASVKADLEGFFSAEDPRRTGKVTRSKFISCLKCAIYESNSLTEDDMNAIADSFTVDGGCETNPDICYKSLLDLLLDNTLSFRETKKLAGTTNNLATAKQFMSTLQLNQMQYEAIGRMSQTIRKLAIPILGYFRDYDKLNTGKIKQSKFELVINTYIPITNKKEMEGAETYSFKPTTDKEYLLTVSNPMRPGKPIGIFEGDAHLLAEMFAVGVNSGEDIKSVDVNRSEKLVDYMKFLSAADASVYDTANDKKREMFGDEYEPMGPLGVDRDKGIKAIETIASECFKRGIKLEEFLFKETIGSAQRSRIRQSMTAHELMKTLSMSSINVTAAEALSVCCVLPAPNRYDSIAHPIDVYCLNTESLIETVNTITRNLTPAKLTMTRHLEKSSVVPVYPPRPGVSFATESLANTKPLSNTSKTMRLEAVLSLINKEAARRGTRVHEFFKDYDPRLTGYIPPCKLCTCLSSLKIDLNHDQYDALLSTYTDRDGRYNGLLNYKRFIEDLGGEVW